MQSLECRVQELESERKTLKRKVVECEEKLGEKEYVARWNVSESGVDGRNWKIVTKC